MLEKQVDLIVEAKRLVLAYKAELEDQSRPFLLGLSGGKTPIGLYQELNKDFDFANSEFFLVDERNVPRNDEKSNYNLISKTLFAEKPDWLNKLHDFDTSLDKEICLANYQEIINKYAPNGLDLAILGIGKDGHFASIFPGSPVWENNGLTVATETAVNEVRERYSLTPQYLFKSRKLLVLLAGPDKMELVNDLLKKELLPENFPAKFLLSHPGLEIIYCRESAA